MEPLQGYVPSSSVGRNKSFSGGDPISGRKEERRMFPGPFLPGGGRLTTQFILFYLVIYFPLRALRGAKSTATRLVSILLTCLGEGNRDVLCAQDPAVPGVLLTIVIFLPRSNV
jgi:hypothetical protein